MYYTSVNIYFYLSIVPRLTSAFLGSLSQLYLFLVRMSSSFVEQSQYHNKAYKNRKYLYWSEWKIVHIQALV